MTDIASKDLDAAVVHFSSVINQVLRKQAKILGVTGSNDLPTLQTSQMLLLTEPTLGVARFGLLAPSSLTSEASSEIMNGLIQTSAQPNFKSFLLEQGFVNETPNQASFINHLRDQHERLPRDCKTKLLCEASQFCPSPCPTS